MSRAALSAAVLLPYGFADAVAKLANRSASLPILAATMPFLARGEVSLTLSSLIRSGASRPAISLILEKYLSFKASLTHTLGGDIGDGGHDADAANREPARSGDPTARDALDSMLAPVDFLRLVFSMSLGRTSFTPSTPSIFISRSALSLPPDILDRLQGASEAPDISPSSRPPTQSSSEMSTAHEELPLSEAADQRQIMLAFDCCFALAADPQQPEGKPQHHPLFGWKVFAEFFEGVLGEFAPLGGHLGAPLPRLLGRLLLQTTMLVPQVGAFIAERVISRLIDAQVVRDSVTWKGVSSSIVRLWKNHAALLLPSVFKLEQRDFESLFVDLQAVYPDLRMGMTHAVRQLQATPSLIHVPPFVKALLGIR
eukprot:Polyplicarium_translucidae@DN1976_c0_g1_i2.p1